MEIHTKTIDSLIFAEYNPRQLTDEQYKQLKDSITRFGLVDPVIVNQHKDRLNIIVGGHQRVKVAKKMGIEDVPCVFVNLNYDKERELNVRLNKNTGGWDYDILADMFDMDELIDWGFKEEELVGFSAEEEEGLIDDDEIPEVVEPVCKLGDIWELGKHRLLCGDSTVKENIELLLDGNKADMVFTDPPYGMNLDTDYSNRPSRKKEGNKTYSPIIGDDNPFNYKSFHWLDCDEQIWFGANYFSKSIDDGGSWLVWDKREDIKFDKMLGSGFELAWSKLKHKQKIYRYNNTLFSGNEEARNKIHPTQKPTGMIIEVMNDFKAKNIILDPFLGSGSTLIACEKTNRVCYGMELDPHYCDVIINRWEQFTGKEAKLLNGSTQET
jgi:DNA modification methylase